MFDPDYVWHPLAHSTLPRFVYQLPGDDCHGKGCTDQMPGLTVRMETPVLYFYAPRSLRDDERAPARYLGTASARERREVGDTQRPLRSSVEVSR